MLTGRLSSMDILLVHLPSCTTKGVFITIPDSKVHGGNMGPTGGRQDPGGSHVGHMNLATWDVFENLHTIFVD